MSKAVVRPIEDCVSFLIGKSAQQITRRCRDALAPFGITPVQYAVLNVLWEKDGQSLAEIGARLVLDSATMTGVVDRLESAGLVSRGPAPNGDRRVICLLLGEPARALAGPAQAALERVNNEVAAELGNKVAGFWAALRLVGNVAAPVPPPAPARRAATRKPAAKAPQPDSAQGKAARRARRAH